MENVTLTAKHESREPSVLSDMSHLSSMLSYGTRCFNRTTRGTGNLQSFISLCLPPWLFSDEMMDDAVSEHLTSLKDPYPDSSPSLPVLTCVSSLSLPLFF